MKSRLVVMGFEASTPSLKVIFSCRCYYPLCLCAAGDQTQGPLHSGKKHGKAASAPERGAFIDQKGHAALLSELLRCF